MNMERWDSASRRKLSKWRKYWCRFMCIGGARKGNLESYHGAAPCYDTPCEACAYSGYVGRTVLPMRRLAPWNRRGTCWGNPMWWRHDWLHDVCYRMPDALCATMKCEDCASYHGDPYNTPANRPRRDQ